MRNYIFCALAVIAGIVFSTAFGGHVDHLLATASFHGAMDGLSSLSMIGFAMGAVATAPIKTSRSRLMDDVTFAPSQTRQIPIQCDSVYISINCTLSGAIQVTYTGTYTASPLTSFDTLVPGIEIRVGGGRVVKNVRPWLVTTKAFFATGNQNPRKSSAGASALNPPVPTVDGGFAVGTSAQYTTVYESIEIFFKDIMAREGMQDITLLNLSKASTATLTYTFGAYGAVAAANNAATGISYANSTLIVSAYTNEAQNLVGDNFSDLKETTQTASFGSMVNQLPVQINTGNWIRGIWLMVRNGDAARTLSNTAIGALSLKQSGFTPIQEYPSFLSLQDRNRQQFGINAPLVGGASRIDGVAYMDLLNNRDPNTALDARNLQNLQLYVSTRAQGAGADYTSYPVELTLQLDEYVKPA